MKETPRRLRHHVHVYARQQNRNLRTGGGGGYICAGSVLGDREESDSGNNDHTRLRERDKLLKKHRVDRHRHPIQIHGRKENGDKPSLTSRNRNAREVCLAREKRGSREGI